MGRQEQVAPVYALSQETYRRALEQVNPQEAGALSRALLYLRNMSCVGQIHPAFEGHSGWLLEEYGVDVDMSPIQATVISYGGLVRHLNFSGVEVLVIDAEGNDCIILRSMIRHCTAHPSEWPDIIQFETMGHCDRVEGREAEQAILGLLGANGYVVASLGKDSQLVRLAAIESDGRALRWTDTLWCTECGTKGLAGVPYTVTPYCVACSHCELGVVNHEVQVPGESRGGEEGGPPLGRRRHHRPAVASSSSSH